MCVKQNQCKKGISDYDLCAETPMIMIPEKLAGVVCSRIGLQK